MRRPLSLVGLLLVLVSSIVAIESVAFGNPDSPPITGTFFSDWDTDGILDVGENLAGTDARFPSSAAVTAYDAFGASAQGVVTLGAPGSFSIDVSALSGTEFRVEFDLGTAATDAGFTYAPIGADNPSNVTFHSDGDGPIRFGYVPPRQCPVDGTGADDNPNVETGKLFVTCFVNGDRSDTNGPQDTLVSLNMDLSGAVEHLANKNTFGNVWGVAYDQYGGVLYTSAMLKRHTELGPEGLDGLYWMQYKNNEIPTESVRSFSLEDASPQFGYGTIGTRDVDTTPATDPSHDAAAFPLVGDTGIGDIDVSPDGRTLFVVNVEAKRLDIYNVSSISTDPATGAPVYRRSWPIPDHGCAPLAGTPYSFQPWAVKAVDADTALVGVTCADATGAGVYRMHASSAAEPTPVIDVPLEYMSSQRGCITRDACVIATDWSFTKWISDWDDLTLRVFADNTIVRNHQPLLSDIEVADDGSYVIEFMDRIGHQVGHLNYSTDPADTTRYYTSTGGDILHVCADGAINGTGGCGIQEDGVYSTQWPEWYFDETLAGYHTEPVAGGLYMPSVGTPRIVTTFLDPIRGRSGGLVSFYQTEGAPDRYNEYELYQGGTDEGFFGKASGLGDVEGCDLDLQIGNYVWLDDNRNGIADPGEQPLEGVIVNLIVDGQIIATTSTNADGTYTFGSDVVVPGQSYTLQFESPDGLTLTQQNAGANDKADSDVDPVTGTLDIGTPTVTDHTFDAGFVTAVDDLSLIKVLAPGQADTISSADTSVAFQIQVVNQGTTVAIDFEVTDYTPTGTSIDHALTTAANVGNANVTDQGDDTFLIGLLLPGQIETFTVVLVPTAPAVDFSGMDSIVNGAEISSFAGNDVDSTPDASDTDDLIDGPNSHNEINYDPDGDGDLNEPTAGDEDDHDREIIVVTPAPTTTTTTAAATTTTIASTTTTVAPTTTTVAPTTTTVAPTTTTAGQTTTTVGPTTTTNPNVYDLALIKLLNGNTTVAPGDDATFTISVRNQGNIESGAFTITETLPTGLTISPTETQWTEVNNNIYTHQVAQTDSLQPGETYTITFTATVQTGAQGLLVNNAEISNDSGTDEDSTPDQEADDPTIDRTDPNELDIDTETGDEDDHDIAVITVTPNPTTTTSGPTTTTTGLTTTTSAPTTTTVAPTTTTVAPTTTTATPSTITPSTTTSPSPLADLALIKAIPSGQAFSLGGDVTFEIRVQNQGEVTASDVVITDTLPKEMALSSRDDNGWVADANGVLSQTIASLAPGQTIVLPLVATIDSWSDGALINRAEIADDGDGFADEDSEPGDGATDPTIDRLNPGDIDIDDAPGDEDDSDVAVLDLPKASLGDTVWFDDDQDGVQDDGEAGVPNIIVILEKVVDGERVEVGRTLTDEDGRYLFDDLVPGDYTVTFLIPNDYETSPIGGTNDTALDSNGSINGVRTVDGNTYKVLTTAVTNLEPGEHDPTIDQGVYLAPSSELDLLLTKTVQRVGDAAAEWTIRVENQSSKAASGPIVIVDNLPPSLTFESARSPNGWTCSANAQVVTCTTENDLDAGESAEMLVLTTIHATPGSVVTNDASVAGRDSETTLDNNIDNADLTVPEVVSQTDIRVVKQGAYNAADKTIRWDLEVSNLTDVAADNVRLEDPLPATLRFDSFDGAGWECGFSGQTLVCDLAAALGSGLSVNLTIYTTVDAPAGSIITNEATVSTATTERDLTNNVGSADVQTDGATTTSPPVAFTGAASGPVAVAGLSMVLAGLVLLVVKRRRSA